MGKHNLQPGEMKIMNVIWDKAPIRASEIARLLSAETGWSKNTIYTLTTRMVAKGFVRRSDPGFVCVPAVSREEIQRRETRSLLDALYHGSAKLLLARLVGDEAISAADLAELRELLERQEKVKRQDSGTSV